mgnify:CR=1 FL=1
MQKNKKEEHLPLIRLELYTPQGPLPEVTRRKEKVIPYRWITIIAGVIMVFVILFTVGAPLPDFIVGQTGSLKFLEKLDDKIRDFVGEKKSSKPDTTGQKKELRPSRKNYVAVLDSAVYRKKGLRYFVERTSLDPISALYSIDDNYIFIEGVYTDTVKTVDSLLNDMLIDKAAQRGKIITRDSTEQGVSFTFRLEKFLIPKTWNFNYVSIPPYRRESALETVDSLRNALGIDGKFLPVDEKNYERFSRFLVLLDGEASNDEFRKLMIEIDRLPFFLQLKSTCYLPGEEGKGRLIILGGLNYIFPESTAVDTLAKGR